MVPGKTGPQAGRILRVSSVDQNTDRHLEGLDLDKTFTDKACGKDVKRPQLRAALDYLRDGDVNCGPSSNCREISSHSWTSGVDFRGS